MNSILQQLEQAAKEMEIGTLETATIEADGMLFDVIKKPHCAGGSEKNMYRFRPHSKEAWHDNPTPETHRLREIAAQKFDTIKENYGLKNSRLAIMGSAARGYATAGSDLEFGLLIDVNEVIEDFKKEATEYKTEQDWRYMLSVEQQIKEIKISFENELMKSGIEPGYNFFIGSDNGNHVVGRHIDTIHTHDYFLPEQGYVKDFDYILENAN